MTDKNFEKDINVSSKEIIIDGVDVNGCECWKGYCRIASLCDYPGHLCEVTPNCYYKQLKRKEQECKELREDIKEVANLLDLDTGEEYNFGNIELEIKQLKAKEQECKNNKTAYQMELDIYNQECFNLQEELKETLERLDQLKRDNEELKEKVKKYGEINEQETKDYAELKAENEVLKQYKASKQASYESMQREWNQAVNENREIKQTLTEIKEIVITGLEGFCPKCSRKECEDNNCIETAIRDILQKISEV